MAAQEQPEILKSGIKTFHKQFDNSVFAAYGWKSVLGNEEILEKLLSLNLERGE